MRALLVVAIAMVAQPRVATASCVEEADSLRAHLTAESRRARIWNAAWAIGFGVAAAGQLTLALTETKPLGTFDTDFEEQMYVGTTKASLGLAVRLVLPLRVRVPATTSDPCTDVAALRGALAEAGRRERRAFWFTLIGGTAVNLAGTLLLWQRRNFETGALSFATGVPIGPLSAFTQPRKSWKLWARRAMWTAGIGGVAGEPRSLWIAGEF